MKVKKIGLIREGKFPPDSRVALTPAQCTALLDRYPHVSLVVQPSHGRCFKDQEYADAGLTLQEDLMDCDVLLGIKEVPPENLLSGKTYFFFSHTIKKQPANQKLMKVLLSKHITMIDYETLVDQHENRVIAFGRWAGIVGAHNALWTWSRRTEQFSMIRAKDCRDFEELKDYYATIQLPNLRIAVTGTGRVAKGAMEVLDFLKIRKVSPADFLLYQFDEPVYVNLGNADLFSRSTDLGYNRAEFHQHPDLYRSVALPYMKVSDILINGIFWSPSSPRLFERFEMEDPAFNLQVIADISCDIDGSVPATVRTTSISEPVFGYNRHTHETTAPFEIDTIDIMAIDNLPNELPRDASTQFGEIMVQTVLPALFEDRNEMIQKATICSDGHLTPRFNYLADYAGMIQ